MSIAYLNERGQWIDCFSRQLVYPETFFGCAIEIIAKKRRRLKPRKQTHVGVIDYFDPELKPIFAEDLFRGPPGS